MDGLENVMVDSVKVFAKVLDDITSLKGKVNRNPFMMR